MDFKDKLEEYVDLIARVGLNVQKGQPVVIRGQVDNVQMIRMLVEKCYKLGASQVRVDWSDDFITRQKFENAPLEVFQTFPQWIVDREDQDGQEGTGIISVTASNPELLVGIDADKLEAHNLYSAKALKDVMNYTMNDINAWVVAQVPSKVWANKIFPDYEGDKVGALWDAIFKIMRIGEGRAAERWADHMGDLNRRAEFLNEKNFDYLSFKSSNGTNLKLGLPKGHVWATGSSVNSHGVDFVANLPTEEIYTAPDARRVDGVVYSTKPLVYSGNIIDEFVLEFKNGEVVDYSAKKGEAFLKDLLETDEYSKRLGEVALVPYDSPISNSGLLFYSTLFDENASCHLAFGQAYPTSVEGGAKMDKDELESLGINDSLIHYDFMIGSQDMEISGHVDGYSFQIFKNGNWAF